MSYRKEENGRRKAKLMEEMKRNMGIEKEDTRLELVGCDKDNGFRTRGTGCWSSCRRMDVVINIWKLIFTQNYFTFDFNHFYNCLEIHLNMKLLHLQLQSPF